MPLARTHALLAMSLLSNTALLADEAKPAIVHGEAAPRAASTPPAPGEEQSGLFAHLDSEVVSNFSGGLQSGSGLNAVATAGYNLDGARLGLSGSQFTLSAMALHTAQVREKYVGSITNPTGLEGEFDRGVLDNLWWQQAWLSRDDFSLSTRLGLYALEDLFLTSESAAQLANSSFGMDPTLSENFAVSTFPKNGSGLTVELGNAAEMENASIGLRYGLIQGEVTEQSKPFDNGALHIAELNLRPGEGTLLKIGGWTRHVSGETGLRGAYLSAEQRLLADESSSLDGFMRSSYVDFSEAADDSPRVKSFSAIGLNYAAPFTARPKDVLTLAYGYLGLESAAEFKGDESFVEISYIFNLARGIYLQPDLQYIQNPGGLYDNAWVGILRLHIE